jgi:hypothetical protein
MPAATEAAQVGKVEQWEEVLAIIDDTSCPYTSMARKVKKLGGAEVSWLAMKYPVVGHSGVLDNKPATEFNSQAPEQLKTIAQKIWWNPAISDFADLTEVHGPQQEWARQIKTAMVTSKRIIEKRLLSNSECKRQTSSGAASNSPNETRGVFQWYSENGGSLSGYTVPADFRTPAASRFSGALSGLTEKAFLSRCRNAYKQRNGPHHLDGFVGIDLKAIFTDFANYVENLAGKTPTRLFNQEMSSKELVNTVDRLVLDSGTIDLHPTSFLYTDANSGAATDYTHRSGVFMDMDLTGVGFTRAPRLKELPDDGSGKRAICDAIFYHLQENPLGGIAVESNADN